jgi:hypothetical protein
MTKSIFLLAFYSTRPRDPKKTYIAGYLKDPNNTVLDESINITKGLRTRDEINASVILNLSEKKVIKNKFNDNKDFPSLLAHFQEGYPKYLNPLIAQLYSKDLDDANDINVQTEEEENT